MAYTETITEYDPETGYNSEEVEFCEECGAWLGEPDPDCPGDCHEQIRWETERHEREQARLAAMTMDELYEGDDIPF